MVLCEAPWTNALKAIEARIMVHKVIDAATQQVASDMLRRLTTAGTQLEEARKTIKEPYLAAGRAIDEAAIGPRTRIEAAKKRLQAGITAFAQAEADRVAAEERARQAEIRRLEAEAQKERDRLKAIADKAAAEAAEALRLADAAKVPDALGIEEEEPPAPPAEPPPPAAKTDAEVRLEQAVHAPAPVAAKAVGWAMRVTLEIAHVDAEKLPAPFVQRVPLTGLIKSTYCTGWSDGQSIPECPGVVFEIKRTPVSTRQRI